MQMHAEDSYVRILTGLQIVLYVNLPTLNTACVVIQKFSHQLPI
jgi:hypothetical protein